MVKPKPEMVVKFVTHERITNALVMVVFGDNETPELSLAYVRNGSTGFRSSQVVQKSYISHATKRAPGDAYWMWPDELEASK